MVDIVQSDKAKFLIRKIGYSAGLEQTIRRINILVKSYVEEKQITSASWTRIVSEDYGREGQQDRFQEVFGALGVLSVDGGRPVSKSTLDALSLLYQFFIDEPDSYEKAAKAVFLYSLTMSDGELLSALLKTSFSKSQYLDSLTNFRREKLTLFYSAYKPEILRNKLHRVIDFEEQVQRKGQPSATSVRKSAPPFANLGVSGKQRDITKFDVKLSQDWYKKVPGRRQSWCEDIGLWSGREITELGDRYLEVMKSLVPNQYREGNSDPSVILMPTNLEFVSNGLTWALDKELQLDFFVSVAAIAQTFATQDPAPRNFEEEIVESLLPFCFEGYLSADIRFQKLRRELPITVFVIFCLGVAAVYGTTLPNVEAILTDHPERNLKFSLRTSRNSLWGISLKRHLN